MFRSNRKRFQSSHSRSGYRSNQKKRSRFQRWAVLLGIPLTLIGLELLVRLALGVSGKATELGAYQGEPFNITAYRLRYLSQAGKPYDGIPLEGQLKVKHSPLMGYRLVSNQQNNFWQINDQGFRAEQPIAEAKAKNEVRIFVLGGSTAFGQLSSNNQTTFANKLETRLNQQVAAQKRDPRKFRPDVLPYYADELAKAIALPAKIRESNYRVINAAVPGYTSSNELAQLTQQILAYQPDFIVVMDGYADLLLPSSQEGADIPNADTLLVNASGHFFTDLSQSLKHLFYQSYLVRSFQYWVLRPQDNIHQVIPSTADSKIPLSQQLAAEPDEQNRRVSRYGNHLRQITRLTSASKVPLILALQPEITGRPANGLSPREKQVIEQLGAAYADRVKSGYAQLQKELEQIKQEFPKGVSTLNLYDAYAGFSGEAFQDAIHLTDEANTVLANRLYDVLSKQLLQQPKPFGT